MLNLESRFALHRRVRHVPADDIAMVCRVRLARNLAGERFPDWATASDRQRVLAAVSCCSGW